MEFHWKKGCLPKNEYNIITGALRELGMSIHTPCLGGFTEKDGSDYCAVDFINEPKDMKKNLEIVKDFLKDFKSTEEE